HQDAWPAARVERHPVLRSPVQDAEVPPGVPGAVRLDPGRPGPRPRLLPLVQHRAPSLRPRPVDARRRASRPGRAARRGARDRARHGLRGPSRAVSCGPSAPGGAAHRGLAQSPQAQRAGGGGAYSLNSRTGCLILVDRLRGVNPCQGISAPSTTALTPSKSDPVSWDTELARMTVTKEAGDGDEAEETGDTAG